MKRYIFIIFLVLMLLFTTSCKIVIGDDDEDDGVSSPNVVDPPAVNVSTPKNDRNEVEGNKIQKINDDGTKKREQKNQEQEERYPEEDEEDEEIIIGYYYYDAIKYNIYLLRDSVEFKSRNPYRFSCKVRFVEEDIFGFKSINLLEEKKYDDYKFYPKDGEPYYSYTKPFGFKGKGSVKKSDIAKQIYNYVTKNL